MFFCPVQICKDFGHWTHANRLHKIFINVLFFRDTMSLTVLLKFVFRDDRMWKIINKLTHSLTFAWKITFLTNLEEALNVVLGDKILSWKLLLLKETLCPFYKCTSRCVTVGYLSPNGNSSSYHNALFYLRITLLDRLNNPTSLTILLPA